MAKPLPKIAITMGDPNGIGPEIAVKAVAEARVKRCCEPILVGYRPVFAKAARVVGEKINAPVVQPKKQAYRGLQWGRIQARAGHMAFRTLVRAHELIQEGRATAMVTGPINKEALKKARYTHIAHTEILARLNRIKEPLTIFVADNLWIAFFTRHLSLGEAVKAIREKPLIQFVRLLVEALDGLGKTQCRLAMAALNPHAGEGGILGREERDAILPAVTTLQEEGIQIEGPISADSVFHLAREGHYDCVVSLYHDQGHIAAKTASFHQTISLTLGLPYLRTSVDHGTGFDIAGRGLARADSLICAIEGAARLS